MKFTTSSRKREVVLDSNIAKRNILLAESISASQKSQMSVSANSLELVEMDGQTCENVNNLTQI